MEKEKKESFKKGQDVSKDDGGEGNTKGGTMFNRSGESPCRRKKPRKKRNRVRRFERMPKKLAIKKKSDEGRDWRVPITTEGSYLRGGKKCGKISKKKKIEREEQGALN